MPSRGDPGLRVLAQLKGFSLVRDPPAHLPVPLRLEETVPLYQDLISRGKSIFQNIFNQSDQPITDFRDHIFSKTGSMIRLALLCN